VFPRPAGFAEGYVKITGTPGARLPQTIAMQFGSAAFKATGTIPTQMPANGEAILRVKSVEPGSSGNALSGPGSLTQPILNVSASVELFGNKFCGGTDAEDCEAFRTRFLARMAYQPRATDSWIKSKIIEWPCVTRVVERGGECRDCEECNNCGCNDCQGALEFYAIFDGTFDCGLAPQSVIDELNAWLFGTPSGVGEGQVEIGVCGKIFTASPVMVDILVKGLDCFSASQINEIREVIAEIFKRATPSAVMTKRSVEFAIAQVVGAAADFSVEFILPAGSKAKVELNNLVPECDVMPCLSGVSFESTVNGAGFDEC
jgi:hypothetical protein